MNTSIKTVLLSLCLLLLGACSSVPLQTSRLNDAESNIREAEHILARSSSTAAMRAADERLGVARSYIATVFDNKKYLSKSQLQRYHALKRQLDIVYQQINY